MKLVIQRVTQALVSVENITVGEINKGYLIFLGVEKEDSEKTVKEYVEKVVNIRIVSDENNKMNKSIIESNGEILVVSQFTLLANTGKGRRPSFTKAGDPKLAKQFYQLFIKELKNRGVAKVESGKFGAYMEVSLTNDGPVTFVI